MNQKSPDIKVKEDFENGDHLKVIAERYGLGIRTVRDALYRTGVLVKTPRAKTSRSRKPEVFLTSAQKRAAKKDRLMGLSIIDVAIKYDVSSATVKKIMHMPDKPANSLVKDTTYDTVRHQPSKTISPNAVAVKEQADNSGMFIATTATKKIAMMSKRIRAIQGGTSASKSISTLLILIHQCQTDTRAKLTSIVSESLPHLKKGLIRDFLNIMNKHRYYKEVRWNRTDFIYTFETGSQIEFFSVDQPDKVRGPRRDRLFVNEANNVPYESFDQLEIRTKEFVYLDWNPTNEFWFYTEVLPKRTDVEHIILTYKDNEGLDENIVKAIEQRKGNKRWWRVYGEGELGEVDGKIYKDWAIIDQMPHEAKLLRYGVDFGYTDPTAIVAIYGYDGGYIIDEIAFEKEMSIATISAILWNKDRALIVADSAQPGSIADISKTGLTIIGAEKGRDSVANGISLVQDQRISVTATSVNVIKEYRNYMWEKDTKTEKILPVPEHDYSHSMDSIRYSIVSILKKGSGSVPVISYANSARYGQRKNNLY